jgi:dTDP-4-amino-4,6-dideoxygalactose transaminase
MFYQLPPVGNPVYLDKSMELANISVFSSYQTQFYASGTAALAAALVAVLGAAGKSKERAHVEVILPAYGCPDLISAVVFAGVKPVLVDLEADRPWLDLSLMSAAITENTVAIVAVNLFGIAERWPQLRTIAHQNDVVLIEDSAQYFPDGSEQLGWQGDLVVLSFGRGKPVSLLGGGAVLTKKTSLYEHLPKPQSAALTLSQRLLFSLKTSIYNAMISPFLYWLPQALPFLHLGETRYHPLMAIEAMDQVRLDVLASNVSRYQNDTEAVTRCEKISSMLGSLTRVNNLPLINDTEVKQRLLRYPLLVEEASRARVYKKLKQAGLGASTMYPASLPKIAGLSHILDDKRRFINAESFASRLIALPTHSTVSDKSIKKMKALLRDAE